MTRQCNTATRGVFRSYSRPSWKCVASGMFRWLVINYLQKSASVSAACHSHRIHTAFKLPRRKGLMTHGQAYRFKVWALVLKWYILGI